MTRLDVGIVTWNTRDLTLHALDRLLACAGPDVRVLVRDHASADGTAAAVRERFGDRVEVEAHDANPGYAAGVNALLARGDAPWFLALNSDAWPRPGALDALVARAEATPRAALVAPAVVRPDGTPEQVAHPFPTVTGAARGLAGRPPAGADWVHFVAPLLRRSAVAAVGRLDESFGMYAEDLDWCWRARRAGWDVVVEPAAEVVHVGNASGAQAFGDARAAAVARSTDRFLRRTRGPVPATAYRGLVAVAAARQWALARAGRRPDLAAHWAREARAAWRAGRPASGDGGAPR